MDHFQSSTFHCAPPGVDLPKQSKDVKDHFQIESVWAGGSDVVAEAIKDVKDHFQAPQQYDRVQVNAAEAIKDVKDHFQARASQRRLDPSAGRSDQRCQRSLPARWWRPKRGRLSLPKRSKMSKITSRAACASARYPGRLTSIPRAVQAASVPAGDRARLIGSLNY